MVLSLKILARFKPRPQRRAVSIESCSVLPDDRLVSIVIRNIAQSGFMGQTTAELAVGTPFGVVLPGGAIVRAVARWCEGGELGAAFQRPLAQEKLERLAPGDRLRCEFPA